MSYKFFENRQCEFYPCHDGVAQGAFNCLFCYCPLYVMGEKCGGDFRILANGVKDCSLCTKPHSEGGFEHVMGKLAEFYGGKAKKE